MKRTRHLRLATVAGLAMALTPGAEAQQSGDQPSSRAIAPIDITGLWVSLITDDWEFRMLTPARGDYRYVPLNADGRRVADGWDPARDEAAGEACRGYAAPAIMRLPSRVQITWQDEETLRLEIDTGMQIRLLRFGRPEPEGPRTWQGWSQADWELSGDDSRRSGFYRLTGSLEDVETHGSLKVDTSHLRAGYLRKNGVPFSEDTLMTEYFNLIREPDGTEYLVIQTFVRDPRYLSEHFVRTLQFKRETDDSTRNPVPCSAY